MSLAVRLESKIERVPEAGCWLWTGTTTRGGYGQIRDGKKIRLVHRVSYELEKGPIPVGKDLDHLCRVRCCANPAHLEPVTNAQNCERGLTGKISNHNGAKTHCAAGHEYTEGNTYVGANGKRRCKICTRASNQRGRMCH